MKTPRVVALQFMYGVEYIIITSTASVRRKKYLADDQVEAAETPVNVICASCFQVSITNDRCWDRIYCGAMTLTFDLESLTLKLSLDMLRPDLHAKNRLCMSVRSARMARRKDIL